MAMIQYYYSAFDYSSVVSAASVSGSNAFMLRLIFFSASFKSTTLATISCPTDNTSEGFST